MATPSKPAAPTKAASTKAASTKANPPSAKARPKSPAKTPRKSKAERPTLEGYVPEEEERGENLNDVLTDRQIIFCNVYINCWNATQAARVAGYKDPECSGFENRQKPAINRYIQRKIEERCMTKDEVLVHLGDIGRGRHKHYFKFYDAALKEEDLEEEKLDGRFNGDLNRRTYQEEAHSGENLGERLRRVTPYLDVQEMVACGDGHLIKNYDIKDGQICNVTFYDRVAALTLIGRHLKMWTDKVETISLDTPVTDDDLKPLAEVGREELNRRIAQKTAAPRSRRY